MAAGVVTVGRREYAVGLYWENSPGGGRVAQIAKEAAKQPGQQADFYVVRPGNKDGRVPQFGLSSKEAGHKVGMAVLAACLASQLPGSWAGAFRLNQGVVVIIVRDDLIVPDGDLFFRDESEARDRLIQEIGFGGLQTTYAPEAWSIPGADTIPLTLLLNDQAELKLQRVSIPQSVKIGGVAAAVIFCISIGVFWYYQQQREAELALERERQAALERAATLPFMQKPPPEPKYIRTWETAPSAQSIIDNCVKGLGLVPSAAAGWMLQTLTCDGSSISLSWTRSKGETQPPAGSFVDTSGLTASKAIPIGGLSPRGHEDLKNVDEITKLYLSENWPGTINRAPDDPLPLPPPDYTGPWNPPPAPWVKRSFTLSVPELPGGLGQIVGDIPGTIINSLRCSSGGSSCSGWAVEGVIYENRK